MTIIILEAVFGLLMGGIGLGAGLWLRRAVSDDSERAREQAAKQEEQQEQTAQALRTLHELAEKMAADVGEHQHRVEAINTELQETDGETTVVDAVTRLIRANEEMQNRLASAEGKLQEQAKLIETQAAEARTDALTSAFNRRHFDDEMRRKAAELARHGRPVSVLILDVDYFKKFNDTHGHQAGDQVLKSVVAALRGRMRTMDIICRYGGEEFAVIMPGTPIEDARRATERARQAIEEAIVEFEGKTLKVTASCGVAMLQPGESIEALVKRADDCLYESKRAGRNCGHWHDGTSIHRVNDTTPQPPRTAAVAPPQPAKPAADTTRELLTDSLAMLSTRTQFCADVHRRLAEWKRGGSTMTVILVGIDSFDKIIESRGEHGGQLALQLVARFLQAALRDMDHVARYDTEMFGVLLPAARMSEAVQVAERLRQAIARCRLTVMGQSLSFTVSLGLAEVLPDDDCQKLLERAQSALDTAASTVTNASFFHNGATAEQIRGVVTEA